MTGTAENKDTTKGTVTRQSTAKKSDPPREEVTGVLRTSRIGVIESVDRRGSTPRDREIARHETMKNALQPGDEGYNPFTDPLVPTSTAAHNIMVELMGGDESPTWNALKDAEDEAAELFDAKEKFLQDRQDRQQKKAS